MAQVYALAYRSLANVETLCEFEQGVCYFVGDRSVIARTARQMNRISRRKGHGTNYRPVPLPFTTQLPDWFEYA